MASYCKLLLFAQTQRKRGRFSPYGRMFFPIRISRRCEEAGHQAEFKVDASSFSIRVDAFVVYNMISMSDSFGAKYFQSLEINHIVRNMTDSKSHLEHETKV